MDNEELLRIIDNAVKQNLTELDLSRYEITELPPEISKLSNLTKMNLSENSLTQLPSEIGNLTNLTELYLSNNQLTQLPLEIGKLTNLTILHLYWNQLTQLPPEIGNLTNLTYLNLSSNQLTQLPAKIDKLTNLITLELNYNQLTQLPPEIAKLTKLKKNIGYEWGWGLNLKNNNFNVPEEVLEKKDPQEIIKEILFADYREGQIENGELLISIATQRNLRKGELAKITEWLNLFKIKAYFAVDKKKSDIKLPRKNEDAIHEIKQYLSNKYQDHISQIYDQKTQDEK